MFCINCFLPSTPSDEKPLIFYPPLQYSKQKSILRIFISFSRLHLSKQLPLFSIFFYKKFWSTHLLYSKQSFRYTQLVEPSYGQETNFRICRVGQRKPCVHLPVTKRMFFSRYLCKNQVFVLREGNVAIATASDTAAFTALAERV